MLDNATVTMPYGELQGLVETIKGYEDELKMYKDIENSTAEEFEKDPFKRALDAMFDLLDEASKSAEAEAKQYYVYKAMIVYCEAFGIQNHELMEGISQGSITTKKGIANKNSKNTKRRGALVP